MSDNYLQVVSISATDLSLKQNNNVPTELLATWFNTCTPGLLVKGNSSSGNLDLGNSVSVDNNGINGYVNSFKIESEDSFENVHNNGSSSSIVNIIFVILVKDGIQEMYSTTGDFRIDVHNKVIYTSPNNVFKRINAESEYVPHWIMFSSSSPSPSSPSLTINVDSVKQVSNLITAETGNVIYYLNCLSDAFADMKVNEDILSHFLSILMVEIKLSKDYELNREFLKKLVKLGINTDVIKKPVSGILSVMSNQQNPYQIYINGLDFPLMLLQMEPKFGGIVSPTFTKYNDILTYTSKQIKGNESAKKLIGTLMKKAQEETKCAECFVIFNSRKTVAEGKPNERFKFEITQGDRKCIKMLAASSMKQLYDKNGAEIAESFSKSEFNKSQINIDGSNDGRKLKGIFGPFKEIYDADQTNSDIAKSNEMLELLRTLILYGILFIIGWGASGAGKTSKLVYFNKGKSFDEQIGIIIQMCNLLKTHQTFNSNKIGDEIIVRRVELCPEHKTNQQYECKKDNTEYKFTWTDDTRDFKCNQGTKFKSNNPERLNKEGVTCDSRDEGKDNKYNKDENNTCDIGGKTLAEVAELLVDKDRHVNATTNNPNSSRSHTLLFITFTLNNAKKVVIVIGDFAGVENMFSCADLKVYIDFANLNVDKTTATQNEPDKKYYVSDSQPANREEIYDFADVSKLFKYIGDKNLNNDNVQNGINLEKSRWVENLYSALLGNFGNRFDLSHITNALVEKIKNNFNIDNLKSLFKTKNYDGSKVPLIISEILKSAIKSDQSISLPKITGWAKTGSNDLTNEHDLSFAGYTNVKISLVSVYSELNNNNSIWNKIMFDDSIIQGHIYYAAASASAPRVKYVIIDNPSKGKVTGIRFKIKDNKLIVTNLSNSDKSGTTYIGSDGEVIYSQINMEDESAFRTADANACKTELSALLSTNNTNIFEKLSNQIKVKLPNDKDQFNKMVTDAKSDHERLNERLDAWKKGEIHMEFYAVCSAIGFPMKVTISGELSLFDENVSEDQTKANKMVSSWNVVEKAKAKAKAQFVIDLQILFDEISRHHKIMTIVITYCQLRLEEGIFINMQLALLTKAVDAVYSMKNLGQPLLPKFVPGSNDFFEGRHIFKVLDKVAYTTESFKTVVDQSIIMKAIFDMCLTIGVFNDSSSSASSASSVSIVQYEKFATALSVVYFLVFDLSRNSEKQNKIQYIDINGMFDLLRDVEYDMELESMELVVFNNKKSNYLEKLQKNLTTIHNYFIENGIDIGQKGGGAGGGGGGGRQQIALIKIAEITSMFVSINAKYTTLNNATGYKDFLNNLNELIQSIDNINMITSIGTLQTVSRRMNGVKKLIPIK